MTRDTAASSIVNLTAALAFLALVSTAVVHAPPPIAPQAQILTARAPAPRPAISDPSCSWVLAHSGRISAWTQSCITPHGQLRVVTTPQGFAAEWGARRGDPVLRGFAIDPASAPDSWARHLRSVAQIPAECTFQPLGGMMFALVPTGARKAAYERAGGTAVPPPPCGPYGISTHGQRVFTRDPAAPDLLIYVDQGSDTALVDLGSIRVAPQG